MSIFKEKHLMLKFKDAIVRRRRKGGSYKKDTFKHT